MRTPTFYHWTRTATVVAVLLAIVACGKDGDDKKDKKRPKTTIASAEVDGNGNAVLSFTSESQTKDFYCRVITAETEGEWYPCPDGTTSYQLEEGQDATFYVKNGLKGEVVERRITRVSSSQPTEAAGAIIDESNVWNLIGLNTGLLPLGSEDGFRVKEGKRIIRWSVREGEQDHLTVFKLVAPDSWANKVSHLTQCSGQIIQGRSTLNGPISTYCMYKPTFEEFKAFERNEMALNHVEIGNEDVVNGVAAPVDFVAASVFTNETDERYTKRLFIKHCGIPPQYQQQGQNQNQDNTYPGSRPNGFKDGGTIYNLPVFNTYFPGQMPGKAEFHWCVRDVNYVRPQGAETRRLFVGTFEAMQTTSVGTKKRIVYSIIQEQLPGFTLEYEFANSAARTALETLYPMGPLNGGQGQGQSNQYPYGQAGPQYQGNGQQQPGYSQQQPGYSQQQPGYSQQQPGNVPPSPAPPVQQGPQGPQFPGQQPQNYGQHQADPRGGLREFIDHFTNRRR